MTQSSTGQTSEDGNNINRKLASVARRRSLSVFRRETRTIRFYWQHSPWLTQFALGRADNALLPPPLVVCRQCFLSIPGNANVFPGAFRDFSAAPLRRAHYKINTARSFVLQ